MAVASMGMGEQSELDSRRGNAPFARNVLGGVSGLARALTAPLGGLFLVGRAAEEADAGGGAPAGGALPGEQPQSTAGLVQKPSLVVSEAVAADGAAPGALADLGAAAGTAAEPDASRGFDVAEYRGLWQVLAREKAWPSVQRFAVVGPAGEEFAGQVVACVVRTLCWDPVQVSSEPRSRWQSVRVEVRCTSPDDFCALHSNLKRLDGVRFIL
mmetsp:Transcript_95595/g.270306  ORF Transcript_95595/g.270306 Transcript_95595/m.270306 type:complete len:213 (-) Transcript_95595:173-811(-)|eukprot:CAMPEP_0168438740 /NCGR_PEP_ID=MMETSP0228-20121227/42116_1 /TAXON_ID=133427 /ORGANISM="Protoceratium reticulatum, Strain CCCM 535 (=CCMP 1889)" /LENGTH=212 /DNA_ID=CAMNT_0008453015 /DNA_START=25 /DNA_END=663 /DNA_ORIENTATION=-